MSQVLYRKYRSKNLSEIVGQDHITKTLSEALKSGRISHAYLFTGPRGTGKTSIARILAHEINNLPYTDDQAHIDIIEIDAASNRRIDEIRDLRDKVYISPASAKYKVYIIDEVHMLTKEAFNALLKTLEEPPAHVIFILATTDAHKLPATIISRTQRFSFKPVEKQQVIGHLKTIAKNEKINIDDGALEVIADHGEGSFRDSISLLDQVSGSDKVTADQVLKILGIPSSQSIDKIIAMIETKGTNYSELNSELIQLYNQGYSAPLIAKALMNEVRTRLVNNGLKLDDDAALNLLKQLIEVSASSDPSSYLEITLLSLLNPSPVAKKPVEAKSDLVEPEPEAEAPVEKPAKAKSSTKSSIDLSAIWPEVLNNLKTNYNTLYGMVRMAEPVFKDDNRLELIFDFAFHQKRLNDTKNKQILAEIILELTGQDYSIEGHLNTSGKPSSRSFSFQPVSSEQINQDLDNINSIFGGAELDQ